MDGSLPLRLKKSHWAPPRTQRRKHMWRARVQGFACMVRAVHSTNHTCAFARWRPLYARLRFTPNNPLVRKLPRAQLRRCRDGEVEPPCSLPPARESIPRSQGTSTHTVTQARTVRVDIWLTRAKTFALFFEVWVHLEMVLVEQLVVGDCFTSAMFGS